MKIIGLITHLGQGGAQGALIRLMTALRARGHEMEIWALYRHAGVYQNETHVRLLSTATRPDTLGYVRLTARLIRSLRVHRPDAVISFLPLACLLGLGAARLIRIPHRIASQRNPGWTYSAYMRLADAVLGSTGFYTCNVAVSQSVLDSFDRYPASYRRRLICVHNGIVWTPSVLAKAAARRRFGLDPLAPLAVVVGRLSEQKNHALLLRVLTRVPEAHLAIAGNGPLKSELVALAKDLGLAPRVHFLGFIEKEAVPDLLRAADVFVQPSLFEGQSNALLQAMHEGLAVLASDIPAQRETLCDLEGTEAGLLLPVGADRVWSSALADLMFDPERRKMLGARAKSRVRVFTLEAAVDGFERALCTCQ